jgi:oligopeptide transport system substrate-binding protein
VIRASHILTATLLGALCLTSCAREAEDGFIFNNGAEPETLDPHLMTGVPEHRIALALYEGLVREDPKTLAPLPGVAESWEISADAKTYTFKLREGAKFSNGDPLGAEDFVWSWQRALSPKTASQYAEQLYAITNAKAFNEGKLEDFAEVGVKAPDERTLVVTLDAPTPYFLELLSFQTLMPVHRATVEGHAERWTRPGTHVGNGPFVLAEWRPRDQLVLTPNPHYWDAASVKLPKIRIKAMDDLNTAYAEYQAGKLHWMPAVPQTKIDEVQAHPDYYVWPYLGSYFFRFNVTKPPFDDVRVRKAFTMSVDKKSVCQDVLKAGQIPATGYVPPSIHGYEPVVGLPYDPAAANALMFEAGFPGGEGFPEVELLYNTNEAHKQVSEALAQMWRDRLGVTVKLRNMEWQTYLKDQRSLNYTICRAGWIGDYADPNTFLDMFVTDRGNNNTGWSNAEYDEALAAAAKEQDPAKRMAIFRRAEEILIKEDLPILPIYFYVNQGLKRPEVSGLHQNIRDLHPFQGMELLGPAK